MDSENDRMVPAGIHALFVRSASGWDFSDGNNAQFYDAELAIDLGRFKAGTIVEIIALQLVDVDQMVAEIYVSTGAVVDGCRLVDTYQIPLTFTVVAGCETKIEHLGN